MENITLYQDLYFYNNDEIQEYMQETKEAYELDDDASTDLIFNMMNDDINLQLDDLRRDFAHKSVYNDIIALADLGRWNGRVSGYRTFDDFENSLSVVFDCLDGDYCRIYIEDGDLKSECVHHDGRDYVTYRERNTDNDEEWDEFLDKIYDGKATMEDVDRCTKSLADLAAE